ncbi:VOC family protein [Pseudonocardia sp. N23]|uniref:VOC family protein n=1 Tax=Pseudonocardia sp. N23 TaxID=1987376 RepID=UPI000BFDA673|nr:VOC family protein [Pseudonocardia sp. N23]GAY07200.1 glyoxalase/bleomycin resistance protein [Pseudonocardia sp. N23]
MEARLNGFHHVKLPVSDVARSRDWYCRVLGYTVDIEFVEDGVLAGVGLADPGRTAGIALRGDPDRAVAMKGFDAFALGLPSVAEVARWRERLDALGEPHGGVVTGARGGSVLVGLHDPDGIEIRLYADPDDAPTSGGPGPAGADGGGA